MKNEPHSQLPAVLPDNRLATRSEPSTGELLRAVIDRGVTAESVAVVERLVALKERQEERDAEKAFNSAFVALQQELPVIVAKTVIPNRGKYERFEDLCSVVNPLLVKHGFSIAFSQDAKDNRVIETCHLRHMSGHSQANSFAVRVGRADSETQADCKAATTAKRLALCNALNIVIRQDRDQNEDDATHEGAFIAPDKVQYLRERLAEVGGNEAAFLAIAGASKFEEICEGSYPVLVRTLEAKARAKK